MAEWFCTPLGGDCKLQIERCKLPIWEALPKFATCNVQFAICNLVEHQLSRQNPSIDLQAVQIFQHIGERDVLAFGLFGHPIDLVKGRDSASRFQHSIGVKR